MSELLPSIGCKQDLVYIMYNFFIENYCNKRFSSRTDKTFRLMKTIKSILCGRKCVET
jgi:hypothetical protein